MALIIKAKYVNGTLKPLEPLKLKEGAVVTISVEQEEKAEYKTHSVITMVERIRESMGEDAWDGVPTDGSINYRHYLYGHPKVGDE